jgi:TM2 domain-containing membrane protein YozV
MFCRNCGEELAGASENCMNCGAKPMAGTSFCPWCGAPTLPLAEICVKCGTRVAKKLEWDISPKSRLATTLLAFFLGGLGVHRFYIGKTETAIVMLLLGIGGAATTWFLVGLGYILLTTVEIWALVDFIFAVAGRMRDKEDRLIQKW